MPRGVTQVRVKLVDSKNKVLLSRDIDVESGYKFIIDVIHD